MQQTARFCSRLRCHIAGMVAFLRSFSSFALFGSSSRLEIGIISGQHRRGEDAQEARNKNKSKWLLTLPLAVWKFLSSAGPTMVKDVLALIKCLPNDENMICSSFPTDPKRLVMASLRCAWYLCVDGGAIRDRRNR